MSQGVGKSSINIGIRYYPQESIQAFTVAYGVNAGALPDPKGYAQAVVDHINAGGGMHGLKVNPVWAPVDALRGTAEVDRVDQESCTQLTEDTKVFAAVTSMPGNLRTFAPCMAAKNTPVISDPLLYVDKPFIDRTRGFLYMPSTPEANRMSRFWIDGLASTGYFAKGAKVGLLRYEEPTGAYARTAKNAVVPALARHGVKLTREFVVSNYLDSSQFANAVLQMKTAGVTRLLIMDVSSLISFFFMTQAETQDYRPAYGLNSFSVGTFLSSNAPEAQLRSIMSVGWLPSWDVTAPQSPPATAARSCACRSWRRRASASTARWPRGWRSGPATRCSSSTPPSTGRRCSTPRACRLRSMRWARRTRGWEPSAPATVPDATTGPPRGGCCGTPPRAPAFATRAATGPPTDRRRLTLSGRP